jgi:GT2 family glycosyltransferase
VIAESQLFDTVYYLANNPDVAGDDPLRHFVESGVWQGRRPNRVFDPEFYFGEYRDIAQNGVNPLVHYIEHGEAEGRWPHPSFDPGFYRSQNPDIAKSRESPLLHFLAHGEREGRKPCEFTHQQWCFLYETLSPHDRIRIDHRMAQLALRPRFSLILPLGVTRSPFLRDTIASIERQIYPDWELCVAFDPSTDRGRADMLEALATADSRVRLVKRPGSLPLSAAVNTALEIATGGFVALVEPDDELAETALYLFADEINRHPIADILYGDDDRIDRTGCRHEPHFKPDWNPDLFHSWNYVDRFVLCRTALLREIGGLRSGFDGCPQYDMLLRLAERTGARYIRHLPFLLYHRRIGDLVGAGARDAGTHAVNAARHALSDHFFRTGQRGVEVVPGPGAEHHRVIRPVPRPHPLVSFILPTGGRTELVRNCVAGVLEGTDYDNIEIILLYNNDSRPEVLPYLEEISADPRVTVVHCNTSFNFSRICNIGVGRARGDIVCLLNDDIEVIAPGWLLEMVSHALRPEVGAVGAMLYYPDDTIQHAGVILGLGDPNGIGAHVHRRLPRGAPGYFHRALLTQNLSCITAACLVLRKEAYCEVGGFDEAIAVDFNDVDFCIKVRDHGYLIVWTPYAELYHLESVTRGEADTPEKQQRFAREVAYLRQKWHSDVFALDPYHNRNLKRHAMHYEVSTPPRVTKPWASS